MEIDLSRAWPKRLRKFGKKGRGDARTVRVGNTAIFDHEVPQEKFPNNRIVSSKYTIWNFPAKNLFEQFRRIANLYFLCVAVIQLSIDSPVSPATVILPLTVVISVTMVKQGYEDYLRHKADRKINNRSVRVLRNGAQSRIKSMDLQVGDIIRCDDDDEIPCDIVLLSSSDENGECYINTANLDGEANLKTYRCVPEVSDLNTCEALNSLTAVIECEQPNPDLHKFVGRMHLEDFDRPQTTIPLGHEHLLLRGSRLKETSFVFGCAVYTGRDTKMSLNSKAKRAKFSTVERSMNKYLLYFLSTVLVESAILTGVKRWWYSQDEHSANKEWYRPREPNTSAGIVVEEFFSFMVLVNYVIPISLYVTVEFQKFFGSLFFGWDVDMFDEQMNEPAKANTSDLNEELGQIEYLFTDKTGTLTQNNLEFRQLSAAGIRYKEHDQQLCLFPDHSDHLDDDLFPLDQKPKELLDLLLALSLCHTCRVQSNISEDSSGSENEYHAASTDEKALVEACGRFGVEFLGTLNGKASVKVEGEVRQFTVHHVLHFDPTRRRMSVLVENLQGLTYLMVKGAESAILNRCVRGDVEGTAEHVLQYALLGLRTLCVAQKQIPREEFDKFHLLLKEAQNSLDNRDEKLAAVYDTIERDLTLLGATGVEDKLQVGVPETICALREAGIKLWVLTGDKEETAVNVSVGAGHTTEDMIRFTLTGQDSWEECESTLSTILEQVDDVKFLNKESALVLDGHSLALCLQHRQKLFQRICTQIDVVLACRLSPLQKAEVVRLVKGTKGSPITAAIGDGANDVSMIQQAHVGLGIMGKEGRQAAMSSDYAIGQFRHLQRAFLVHGHYYYWRISGLVQYCFYKNVVFITANIYFALIVAFSAQSIYETMQLTMYNTLYTQLPILVYGVYEKHITSEDLLAKPSLYRMIRKNARMSLRQFLTWYLTGLYQSVVCFFGCYVMFRSLSAWESSGLMYGLFSMSHLLFSCVIYTANIKLMLIWYYWTWMTFVVFALTIASFYVTMWVYSMLPWRWIQRLISNYDMYGVMLQLSGDASTWLTILVIVTAAALPDMILRTLRDTFQAAFAHKTKTRMNVKARCSGWLNCRFPYRGNFSLEGSQASDEITIV